MRPSPQIAALAVVLLVLALVLPSAASATPSTPVGVVTASGTALALDGHPWKFVGYNMPCAQPFLLDQSQLPFVFASIANNSGANALRVWFFQQNGGPGNWAPFDRVEAAAKADGIRLVPTLVNEWATCEANPPITTQKTLQWFQEGYRKAGDGYRLSFRDFATQVAAHFANDPTIAFWQLVNEATAPTPRTCDESAAAHSLRSFADDMTNAIHTVDPHHLVSLGTLGGSQCGSTGADYQYIHAGAVDLCEFHDYYDNLASPMSTDRPQDGLAARLHQCQTIPGGGKPFFIGESGLLPNLQPAAAPEPTNCGPWPSCSPTPVTYDTLNLRASFFKTKITTAFASGVSGYLVWFKGPHFSATNDSYAIGDGDPTEATMAALSLHSSTQATVPDPPATATATAGAGHRGSWTNSPTLLVGGGGILLVAWIFILRARRRPRLLTGGEALPPS